MATALRLPLAPCAPHQLSPLINRKVSNGSTLKRPRSPEPPVALIAQDTSKRHRSHTQQAKEQVEAKEKEKEKEKERRRAEREAQKEEFRVKYTKAFPSWTFYFDTSDAERDILAPRVVQLNGRIAKFFSNEVTHFITNRPTPEVDGDKENTSKAKASGNMMLRSPIKLRGLPVDDLSASGYETLVRKAKQFGMKIWDTAKLDSVLERCYVPAQPTGASAHGPSRSLTSLLESERKYGTTSERDPTQRRHDYHYFSKGSYFILVEDIRQELATIAALEYPVTRTSDGKEKGSWPIPHCHPLARGPFIEYNEKEERRREKQERYEREREEVKAAELKKLRLKQVQRKQHDLRRSVSMNNLQREAQISYAPADCETFDSANGVNASGHLGSYIAASGNSVGITSTYGTTSTVGTGSSIRNSLTQLPPQLRDRLQNQVVTTRRIIGADKDKGSGVSKASASSTMMPPPEIPERKRLLRKSKSTNTLRLPRRDEKSKPGYCESCRQKFDNFNTHIRSRKHQKFANNDANFAQLDAVLSRVRRPTIAEVEKANQEYEASRQSSSQDVSSFGNASGDDKVNEVNDIDNDGAQYIYLDDDDDDMGGL